LLLAVINLLRIVGTRKNIFSISNFVESEFILSKKEFEEKSNNDLKHD